MVPSTRLAFASKVVESHNSIHDIEALEGKRKNIENRKSTYQRQVSKVYNK